MQDWTEQSRTFSSAFGSEGTGNGQFESPAGIAIDPAGNLWVVDSGNGRIEDWRYK